ncbi:hypothetical protein [Ideonella sp. A 288]|uniref:hypothetical protein n=1 Tax=Ideonella sp. A 288 TaxID=1962181 RepID=UPI00130371E7|nr:hypothetical protein [Ideonella sp. A 288]
MRMVSSLRAQGHLLGLADLVQSAVEGVDRRAVLNRHHGGHADHHTNVCSISLTHRLPLHWRESQANGATLISLAI